MGWLKAELGLHSLKQPGALMVCCRGSCPGEAQPQGHVVLYLAGCSLERLSFKHLSPSAEVLIFEGTAMATWHTGQAPALVIAGCHPTGEGISLCFCEQSRQTGTRNCSCAKQLMDMKRTEMLPGLSVSCSTSGHSTVTGAAETPVGVCLLLLITIPRGQSWPVV